MVYNYYTQCTSRRGITSRHLRHNNCFTIHCNLDKELMDLLNNYSDSSGDEGANASPEEADTGIVEKNRWIESDSENEGKNPSSGDTNGVKTSSGCSAKDSLRAGIISAAFLLSADTSEESKFLTSGIKREFTATVMSQKTYGKTQTDLDSEPTHRKRSEKDDTSLKTKPACVNFTHGRCKYGTACRFSHEQQQSELTDLNNKLPKERESVKDRVKKQRLAGQTGIQGGWKSEEEMRQRHFFDS